MDEMEAFRERFWGGIDVRGSDDCWLYVGQPKVEYPDVYVRQGLRERLGVKSPRGYIGTHVLAFTFAAGHPPENWVLHHCDTPRCCNPAHLYDGDVTQNNRDRVRRGRANFVRGEQVGNHRLTWPDVEMIRSSGQGDIALARQLGVHYRTVYLARIRKTWRVR